MALRKEIITSAIAVLVLTVFLGVLYPLVVTGVSQVAFPGNANGQKVYAGGKLVGSKIIGQNFGNKPQYFQSRPPSNGYNDAATEFANYGPNSKITEKAIASNIAAYIKLNGSYYPGGLTAAKVPVDAADTSASGVDPDISVANADIQAYRVARVRHLPLATVKRLIAGNTAGRGLGFSREPGVNVPVTNLALNDIGKK